MNPKIKAALYARGMIDSLEATDAECKAALAGFFRGSVPEGDKAILEGLNGSATLTATIEQSAEVLRPAPNVQAAHDRELAEARAAGAQTAQARMASIQLCGSRFGMSAEAIQTAVASAKPLDTIVAEWNDARADAEQPIMRVGNPRETGALAFERDATTALQLRAGVRNIPAANINDDARRLTRASLFDLAVQSLQLQGLQVDQYADREEVARIAMRADGAGAEVRTINAPAAVSAASGGPVLRPGSFPNLFDNLANTALDDAIELADPTYPEWTGLWRDELPDFKPAKVVNKSQHDELDQLLDSEAFKEFGLAEECLSYMQLARYGNKAGLTPVMVANDSLGAFMEDLLGLSEAGENTTNRLCLGLVTGNASLLDGVALYDDSTHANVLTSGGAVPGVTTWDLMLQKAQAQRGIGGKGYVRTPLEVILIPPALQTVARQAFSPMNGFPAGESKTAITDSTLNPFRGTVKIVVEPELQGVVGGNAVWYGFASPTRRATVVRAYFRGYGRAGKRERWYDPDSRTMYVSLETRVGAAVKNYRYTVRNPGS